MVDRKKHSKGGLFARFGLVVLIIILVNFISSMLFTRFDLTSEKRYTLSKPARTLLESLDDVVYFEVYLDGDLRGGFKRLRRETKEMLDQFRAYSGKIEYSFINPSASEDNAERNNVYLLLMEKGLNPTDLQVRTNEGTERKIIFPGALVSYNNKELPLELLQNQKNVSPEEVLNNSVQNLEYLLASAIKTLTVNIKPKIAFIQGHGELEMIRIADIYQSLSQYFDVEEIKIDGQLNSLTERVKYDSSARTAIRNKFEAIIIAKPDSVFNERDKFIIDQFIMRGGKVLWMLDPVFAEMDSLQRSSATMGIINNTNLEDQLFTYGARLNYNLVMDLSALPIPMVTGQVGGEPQIEMLPWYFFPVLFPLSDHSIVKNINPIKTEFISVIDPIDKPGIRETILLTSSDLSRTLPTPAFISLDILQQPPDQRLYNESNLPVALLLEGQFKSLYDSRIPPEIRDDEGIGFLNESKDTRMIVVGDGDIIKNQLGNENGQPYPLPLGYDKYTGETFGNKDFIINAVNYLVDNDELITIRARDISLRLLDQNKISSSKIFWQLFNVVLPIVTILILGIMMMIMRKRKYRGKKFNKPS